MAPYGRIPVNEEIQNDVNVKKGAVAVIVYPKGGDSFIALIKRPDYNGVHGGQVSFPGGKSDKADLSILHTSIRETKEEIGVQLSESDFLFELTQVFIPPSNFLVTPFLFFLNETPDFFPEKREVEHMLEIPVSLLLDDDIIAYRDIKTLSGMVIKIVPYYQLGEEMIWGATAVILSEMKELIKSFED
jgi:8-oxo-dGTP pyrophosphatase MutT (NUDIX family)